MILGWKLNILGYVCVGMCFICIHFKSWMIFLFGVIGFIAFIYAIKDAIGRIEE